MAAQWFALAFTGFGRAAAGARILTNPAVSVVVAGTIAVAPAGAFPAPTDRGIDYTKPFIYDAPPLEHSIPGLMKEGKHREALRIVRRQLDSKQLNAHDRAMLLRLAAQLEVELGNLKQAIKDMEATFETGVLTEAEKAENYYFLGRLYLGIHPPDYGKAVENLRKHIELADDPDPEAYFYLGQALSLSERYAEAIPHAEKAIELAEKPDENHYRLLLFCHSELGNYEKVVSLTKFMIEEFEVKDEYLSQLAAAYSELGRDRDAFLVQAQRYELGLLDTEDEFVGMAELYLTYDNPHRAARLLEKEMKAGRVSRSPENLEKLGNMWFLAREYDKALKYLKEAADESEDGTLDFRVGQAYFEKENWSRAEAHFRRALRKGGLDMPCLARIMLAHALNNQGRTEEAMKYFELADKSEACKRDGTPWIQYLAQRTPDEKTTNFWFMEKVIAEQQKAYVAVSDDENVRAIAAEALEAARTARDAKSEEIRKRKLSEYQRARDSVLRRLNAGALEEAREDLAEMRKLVKEARAKELTEDERRIVDRFEKMAERRVAALEAAQADLEEAAKIAAQARKTVRETGEEMR